LSKRAEPGEKTVNKDKTGRRNDWDAWISTARAVFFGLFLLTGADGKAGYLKISAPAGRV